MLDVGKRVLGPEISEQRDEVVEASDEDGESFLEIERSLLGCNHAQVGAIVVKRWGLPEALQAAIEWHHNPSEAQTHQDLVWICHLADFLSTSLGGGGSVEGMSYPLNEGWQEHIPLSPAELIGLLPVVHEMAALALEDFVAEAA